MASGRKLSSAGRHLSLNTSVLSALLDFPLGAEWGPEECLVRWSCPVWRRRTRSSRKGDGVATKFPFIPPCPGPRAPSPLVPKWRWKPPFGGKVSSHIWIKATRIRKETFPSVWEFGATDLRVGNGALREDDTVATGRNEILPCFETFYTLTVHQSYTLTVSKDFGGRDPESNSSSDIELRDHGHARQPLGLSFFIRKMGWRDDV